MTGEKILLVGVLAIVSSVLAIAGIFFLCIALRRR